MIAKKESLRLLSDMIALAKADNVLRMAEYNYLLCVSDELGVDEDTFERLFISCPEKVYPVTIEDKILHFHRLITLMNIDYERHKLEIDRLYVIGLGIGFSSSLVLKMIDEMENYLKGNVPYEVLLELAKE